MMVHIVLGEGITGTVRYLMGEGNDRETGARRTLAEGAAPRAELLGGQNFGFEIADAADLDLARRMMEWSARPENQAGRAKTCVKDCLHISLSWEKGQEPSEEEMIEAAQSLLKSLGMEGARAVFVAHRDTTHRHMHIAASRIDPETRKTFSDFEVNFKSQAWGLRWEREHNQRSENENRQKQHKILDAIEARDGAAIVAALTERVPTFTARELDKALRLGIEDKRELATFKGEILADQKIIGLREQAEGPVARYTTREVLAAEMALQRNASILAAHDNHGLSKQRIAATAAAHTLKPEQAEALAHLTGAKGFAVLWGEAGTGKSHCLNAVRAAYEAEGVKVVGLSHTNKVVRALRGDGFINANTIDAELNQIAKGKTRWDRNTVLIVDEAAMVSTDRLAKLAAAARESGCKLILAGDDRQLGAINERGGMFETLRVTHGAAILKEVQRVKELEERRVFGEMHDGEFLGALQLADKAGRLHWTNKQADTVRALTEKYTADVAADPTKRRMIFAFSNAEVDGLNDFARNIFKQRGGLGADHELQTASGAKAFATGDRVLFSGGGRTAAQKRAGLINGNAGIITGIDTTGQKPRVTVQLDAGKGQEPRSLTFTVGDDAKAGEFNKLKLGYCGTIHKGQGDTLDQTYVCHSSLWKNSAAYVALTRHRETVEIFASRETVRGMEKARDANEGAKEGEGARTTAKDLEILARGLGRSENKRAATAYRIDAADIARASFAQAALEATEPPRPTVPTVPTVSFPPVPAAARAAPVASAGRATQPATGRGARQASTGKQKARTAGAAAKGLRGVSSAAANVLGGIASLFEGLLGGARTPEQIEQAKFDERNATVTPAATPATSGASPRGSDDAVEAFLEAERQQRAATRALRRAADAARGEGEAQETAIKKDRDRGGGQSL